MIRILCILVVSSVFLWPMAVGGAAGNRGDSGLPVTQFKGGVAGSDPSCLIYESERYKTEGHELAEAQIRRGLAKPVRRSSPRDQSFEGLRDVVSDSHDPEILAFASRIDELETMRRDRSSRLAPTYTSALIEEMAPIAVRLMEETGLPASVTLAQIILESGWGGSNITILKSNILGIGNCTKPGEFTATFNRAADPRSIPVKCMLDTTAFRFDSIGDSVYFYAYTLLQSSNTIEAYGGLREFIRENRDIASADHDAYRAAIIERLAEGYHEDPAWYSRTLTSMSEPLERFDVLSTCR